MSTAETNAAKWAAWTTERERRFVAGEPQENPVAAAIRASVERGDPFAVVRDRPVGSGVDAGKRIRAANWPTLPAVTDEPVADDSHSPAPQVEIITADADGQDADAMEHDRQRRLARWHRQP